MTASLESLERTAERSVFRFTQWLDSYGETSYDYQDFFASSLGGKAKALYYRRPVLGTLAVAPMVLCEAMFPSSRKWFWRKQRFPIADAHFAMGFAYLFRLSGDRTHYEKSLHFLDVLKNTRCPGYDRYCWGYPFNWETRSGTVPANTPLITTTPYAFEAFHSVYRIDHDPGRLEILRSIAEHAYIDIPDHPLSSDAAASGYFPGSPGGVVNASAYRSFVLMSAALLFPDPGYREAAERNLNFVLRSQQNNGSWFYAMDDVRDFIDHFHTCFVLKALAKIERLTGHPGCQRAIRKGLDYYLGNLFHPDGRPKPFSRAPRLTVYRQELYDYAECINLCVLLMPAYPDLEETLRRVLSDLFERWQNGDGSFRARKLHFGWDNVPMHRWGQSQLFRSLCFFLHERRTAREGGTGSAGDVRHQRSI